MTTLTIELPEHVATALDNRHIPSAKLDFFLVRALELWLQAGADADDFTAPVLVAEALQRQRQMARLERLERDAYLQQPVMPGEFDGWESEQVWGDE